MTVSRVGATILPFVFVAVAMGQQSEAKYSIGGTTVNKLSGEALKGAMVRLFCFGTPGGAAADRAARSAQPITMTDDTGHFQFQGILAGRCTLSAQKQGFEVQRGVDRTLEVSASIENVVIDMLPLAVITGKVADQDGSPVGGVTVLALTAQIIDGYRQNQPYRTVTTDDRGIFRMWNFPPGKYYIKAAGRTGGTNLYAGDTSPLYMSEEAFAPVFFGGAKSLESAAPVTLRSGEESHADIKISWEPAYKIRGQLENCVPRRTVKFELGTGNETVPASRVSVNGDTGRFEIQDVVPGQYRLRASQNDNTAELQVSIGAGDLSGITLNLSPPMEVRVVSQLVVPSGAEPPNPGSGNRRGRRGTCTAQLRQNGSPAPETSVAPRRIQSDENGQIIQRLAPGTYEVAVRCFGGYAQSAMWGTQDLLLNPEITLAPGSSPPPIEIAGKVGGGSIAGTVGAKGSDESIGILLIPQFQPSTGPETSRAFPAGGAEGLAHFGFAGLAPGNYIAYAFSKIDDVEYRNPEILKSLSGGIAVQVTEGTEANVTIPEVR